jgi:hydrogenase/urease accessory protein HupE
MTGVSTDMVATSVAGCMVAVGGQEQPTVELMVATMVSKLRAMKVLVSGLL